MIIKWRNPLNNPLNNPFKTQDELNEFNKKLKAEVKALFTTKN